MGHLFVGLTGLSLTTMYAVFGIWQRNRASRFSAPYAALGGAVVGAFVGAWLFLSSTSGGHFDSKANELLLGSALGGALSGAAVGALAGAAVRRPWQAAALYAVFGAIIAIPFLAMTLD